MHSGMAIAIVNLAYALVGGGRGVAMRQWIPSLVLTVVVTVPAQADVLVVAAMDESRVAIVDGRTFDTLASVETGKSPHEVRISPDGRRAYVAAGKTITVVDLEARRRHAGFEVEAGIHDIRVSRDGRRLWAAAGGAQTIFELDAETGQVLKKFDVGQQGPWFVEVSRDERTLFTPNLEGKSVSIIDRDSGAVKVIPFGHAAYGIDITPDGRHVWVSGGDLAVIDTSTKEVVARVKTSEPETGRLRITSDGKKVVLALEKKLVVVDAGTQKIIGEVALSAVPKVLTLSGDGRHAFLTNPADHSMSVVDLQSLRQVKTVATGRKPDGVAWAPSR
jgi:DNA-binding beta-propeller fold protein YncE